MGRYYVDAVMVYYVFQDRFRCYDLGNIYIELVQSTCSRDLVRSNLIIFPR